MKQSNLFNSTPQQPLAEQMRPKNLTDLVGQKHLLSKVENLLRLKRLPSLLLYGPPGCGKSSLALILAQYKTQNSNSHFVRISAPEAGLPQMRKLLAGADVLVLDELHRFSKAQQDFFLPILESGEITLIATTTENPSFSVTRQLLSRLHILNLTPLKHNELMELALNACKTLNIELEVEILQALTSFSGGDARTLLNLLEYIVALPKDELKADKLKELLPELLQVRHDKDGDSHYDLASALIKSIRGSDPDAALYYLACLLEGGEDPRFICRRLILSASEDVGLADPNALPLAVSCQQAVEFVGMPEGFIPLAETVVYLALAPKSNSTYLAYRKVAAYIKENGVKPVPLHLRNPVTKLMKNMGYGKGYLYPHNYQDAYVDQQYLPDDVKDISFYTPKNQGQELRLSSNLKNRKK
ncbi:replication-associated recombination protein A [Desulfovibrio litoralis]|uniref:Replication-associated recombination protein A n=1 Tax=Desulfovibrio litoralis DSM 11393 TaxID=1121455 RepID=A0A1M7SX09_9BACT|nr:replication-associated recombination protein A [Desulfovibrio litoralis]SHN63057.1 Recombination protein MgsA [Desulfovibrio litoralis DSM 11393]